MVRLSGLFFLFPFSLAARIHGSPEPRSIQKRPSVDVRDQQSQDAPVLRLSMNRRPPKLTSTPPSATRDSKAPLALHHSSLHLHRVSSTSSAKPTATPIVSNTTAYFKDAAYGIKLWIGTYGQEVTLDFDTGSSETWVSPPCSAWAPYPEYEDLCRLLGTYVPEQSSTAVEADCPSSWIMYGSGSVFIKYYTDTIQFEDPYGTDLSGWYNSPQLTDVQFGLATDATNMPSGIFGAAYGGAYNQDYPSIIDEMYNQSLIASKDFSVALGSVGEEDGEIVFGGIDLAKFSGPLHEYEISHQLPKTIDGYYRYWVNISSIGVTEPDSCVTVPLTPKGFSERFLPDTGTSLTYMPSYVFNSILKVFPDANMTYEFGYVVSCSHRERKGTIDYTFPDGFTVHVPYSEFIFVIPPGPSNGPVETCIIGAVPTDELFILGDTFLRSVYSVFSQDHHKIYFGNYKDCGTHVVPSRGLKNKGLKGDCPVDDRDQDPKEMDKHYGYPTTPAAGACTSYSTAPHPKSTSHTKSDHFLTEAFNNNGLFRPMIQTGARRDVTSTAAEPTPTSQGRTPHRSVPSLPWSGNITATFLSTGHVASTGFPPLTTGTSSPENTTVSFPPLTVSNTTIPGSTTVLKKSSLTSSSRIELPTSSKTSSLETHKASFMTPASLTPMPLPTISSSSCTTFVSTTRHKISTSSSSFNWWTVGSSSKTSEPSVVTIPIQPDETIVVRLESTTYTIVDGSTLSGGETSTTTSFPSWETSIVTHKTRTSSSTSSRKKKTHSTSATKSTSSSHSHKKTKTHTSSIDWGLPTSISSSSTEEYKYLTSWIWNPTETSEFDPFFTSGSSSSGYPDETTLFDDRTEIDPGSPATAPSSDSSWAWPTSEPTSTSSSSHKRKKTSTTEPSVSTDWFGGTSESSSAPSTTWDWFSWTSEPTSASSAPTFSSFSEVSSPTSESSWSFTQDTSSIASEFSSVIQSLLSAMPTSSDEQPFPFPSESSSFSFTLDTSSSIFTGWPSLTPASSTVLPPVSSGSGWGEDGNGGPESTVTVTGTITHMITVTAHKTTATGGLVARDEAMTVTQACRLGMPDKDCMMKPETGSDDQAMDNFQDNGYDSDYESKSESDIDPDCGINISDLSGPGGKLMASNCLRAMQAHQNTGRSTSFCHRYLEKGNMDNLKVPRYLQTACGVCGADPDMQGESQGHEVDHQMLKQLCKCLMSSSGNTSQGSG